MYFGDGRIVNVSDEIVNVPGTSKSAYRYIENQRTTVSKPEDAWFGNGLPFAEIEVINVLDSSDSDSDTDSISYSDSDDSSD